MVQRTPRNIADRSEGLPFFFIVLLRNLPEWLGEFTEHLVEKRVPASRDTPESSSHESDPEPLRKVVTGKHSIYTHLTKDQHCEIRKKTMITRASCRRRTGQAILRAENFGDLLTADHKVLSEGCESRNNHRYAVVVQDLATPWIQAYPCKTKSSQDTQRSSRKFFAPTEKPKVIYTFSSLKFGKVCENYPGIIVHQRLTVPKQMVLQNTGNRHCERRNIRGTPAIWFG